MKKYILLLLLGLTVTLNAQVIDLQVPIIKQEKTRWCGIAASQCILRYHRHFYQQCTLMDYVRKQSPQNLIIYGYNPCCEKVPNLPYKCNDQGIYLGENNEPGCVKNILKEFGNIDTKVFGWAMSIIEIRDNLALKRPIIVQWNTDLYEPNAHAVVISKIDNNDIYVMDPGVDILGYVKYTYNELRYYGLRSWQKTLVIDPSSPYPSHCYNKKRDKDLGELGVDCGGPCPPCATTPQHVIDECFNCEKNPGEEIIDCGGPNCPPCKDVPEERIITNTNQLDSVVMAFNKITASGATTVASGKKVRFITEDEGSIVLLPGFKAETGSNFSTQRKDLSESSRICGGICDPAPHYLSHHHSVTYGSDYLRIYNLLHAVEIEYRICDSEDGTLIYRNILDITRNGTFELWDCVTGTVNPTGQV